MIIIIIYGMETKTPGAARPGGKATPDASPGTDSDSHGERAPPSVSSSELFAGHSELIIVHARDRYRLRITRNDKLILTK